MKLRNCNIDTLMESLRGIREKFPPENGILKIALNQEQGRLDFYLHSEDLPVAWVKFWDHYTDIQDEQLMTSEFTIVDWKCQSKFWSDGTIKDCLEKDGVMRIPKK